MAYAENTEVAVEKSVSEIITLIKRAGADRIAQFETRDWFEIQFFLHERMLRFRIRWPTKEDIDAADRAARTYWDSDRRMKWSEQRKRQRARALLLVIKAKLESVESEVETFEEAFLANVVMPDGQTVGEHAVPKIADAYTSGKMPQLMLPAS